MTQVTKSIVLNSVFIGLILMASAGLASSSGKVLVFAPAYYGKGDAFAVIASSGGAIVREGRLSSFAVGFSDDPQFAQRLYRSGALLVLSSRILTNCI